MTSISSRKTNMKIILKHPTLAIGLIGIFVLAFIRIVFLINVPVKTFVILCTLVSLNLSREELVSFIVSLIAFSSLFQYRYALYIATFIFLFKTRNTQTKYRYIVLLITLMAWELFHYSVSHLEPYGFLQEFAELTALLIVLSKQKIDYSDGLPIRTLSYSTIISCTMSMFATIGYYGFSAAALVRLGSVSIDEAGDFMGIMNPNVSGFLCLMSICGLLLLRQYDCDKASDRVVIGILFLFMLLTQSRSALLCLIIAYVLYAIWGFNKKKTINSGRIIGSLIGLLIISIIIPFFFGDAINSLIGRFDSGDLSNGRLEIFAFYHMHLVNKPVNYLFGVGLYKYNFTMKEMYGSLWQSFLGLARYDKGEIVYKVCHCNFQEILVAWGIPGMVLIAFLLKGIARHNKDHIDKINYIVFIIILIFTLQFQFLTSGAVILCLLFSLVCMEFNPTKTV